MKHEARRHRADGLPQRRERLGYSPYGSQRLPAEEIGVGNRRHHQDAGYRHAEQTGGEVGEPYRVRDDEESAGQCHHQRDDGVGVRHPHLLQHPAPQQAADTRAGGVDHDAELRQGEVNALGAQQVSLVGVGPGLQQEQEPGAQCQHPQRRSPQGLASGPFNPGVGGLLLRCLRGFHCVKRVVRMVAVRQQAHVLRALSDQQRRRQQRDGIDHHAQHDPRRLPSPDHADPRRHQREHNHTA